MANREPPKPALCTYDRTSIHVRGMNLCEELIGKVNFTQMLFFDILGRMPDERKAAVINAMLVTLMEHGLVPSAIATRMIYSSSPEAMQGAVAAGLLGAGSMMLGTLGRSAQLLDKIVNDPQGIEVAARREAQWHKDNRVPVPGWGHPHHKPDDPRTTRLFELGRELGLPGKHIEACEALSEAVDDVFGKHLTVNASAAMGALLAEIGLPTELMQGFAIICRSAGLVAHIYEEMQDPAAWAMAKASSEAIPYSGPAHSDES